jgi:hypothetical protein
MISPQTKKAPCLVGGSDKMLMVEQTRPCFEEQYTAEEYRDGLVRGKQRMLKLESIRACDTSLDKILKERPEVYEWWRSID